MIVSQCEGCKQIAQCPPPPGWLLLTIQPGPQMQGFLAVLNGNADPEPGGLFCTWKCLADYAVAKALLGDKPDRLP